MAKNLVFRINCNTQVTSASDSLDVPGGEDEARPEKDEQGDTNGEEAARLPPEPVVVDAAVVVDGGGADVGDAYRYRCHREQQQEVGDQRPSFTRRVAQPLHWPRT